MKAIPFHIPKLTGAAMRLQVNRGPFFYDQYHYHPEIQLMLIVKGSGTQIVGDHISTFQPSDITLIGSNLPHVFRCDSAYYAQQKHDACLALLVFFDAEVLGKLLEVPEMHLISNVINQSANGMKVIGEKKAEMAGLIEKMHQERGVTRITTLLHAIEIFGYPENHQTLSGSSYRKPPREIDGKRLNAVYEYLINNLHRDITLSEIAHEANMAPTAFCRFFKQRTDKTFLQFVTELRISHVCRLLVETDDAIAEAAYKSGFNNLSHFNKQFRVVKGITPTQFLASINH